jgi:hypothetical protein
LEMRWLTYYRHVIVLYVKDDAVSLVEASARFRAL